MPIRRGKRPKEDKDKNQTKILSYHEKEESKKSKVEEPVTKIVQEEPEKASEQTKICGWSQLEPLPEDKKLENEGKAEDNEANAEENNAKAEVDEAKTEDPPKPEYQIEEPKHKNSALWLQLKEKFDRDPKHMHFYNYMNVEALEHDPTLKTVTIAINSSVWQQTVPYTEVWQCQDTLVENALSAYNCWPFEHYKVFKFLCGPTFSGLLMFWKNEDHYFKLVNNVELKAGLLKYAQKKQAEKREKRKLEKEKNDESQGLPTEDKEEEDEKEGDDEDPDITEENFIPPKPIPEQLYTLKLFVDDNFSTHQEHFDDIEGLNLNKDNLAKTYIEANAKLFNNCIALHQMKEAEKIRLAELEKYTSQARAVHQQTQEEFNRQEKIRMQQQYVLQQQMMQQNMMNQGFHATWGIQNNKAQQNKSKWNKAFDPNNQGGNQGTNPQLGPQVALTPVNPGQLPENQLYDADTIKEVFPGRQIAMPMQKLNQYCQKSRQKLEWEVLTIGKEEFHATTNLNLKSFTGSGKSKKEAKFNCATAACFILNVPC